MTSAIRAWRELIPGSFQVSKDRNYFKKCDVSQLSYADPHLAFIFNLFCVSNLFESYLKFSSKDLSILNQMVKF